MTVSILARHELSRTDSNDNETCCSSKCCGRTESLLRNLSTQAKSDADEKVKRKKSTEEYDDIYYEKARRLLRYEDAPEYMKHNEFIETGYRGILNTKLCLESLFWWTNETINIWSHIFGFFLFTGLALRDIFFLEVQARVGDKIIVATVLVCFQACMLLSALYHTFCCRSEQDCDIFLCYDLFGIALSLLAIYASGIYYAFWCDKAYLNFYLFSITAIFVFAMVMQLPSLNVHPTVKMIIFVAWAAYGVVPTVHWTIVMGGFANPLVQLLVPRVLGMYAISGTAFLVYLTKIPERFFSGKFDYLGHSHQWWHTLVVCALYYWHNSGMIYLDYRHNHACASHMTIL